MAFLALAAPAFLGGLVTGLFRPPLPFRKGKKGGDAFKLWSELAQVCQPSHSPAEVIPSEFLPQVLADHPWGMGHDIPCQSQKPSSSL